MWSIQKIISLVISAIVIGTILPLGIVYIVNMGNVRVTVGNVTKTTTQWLTGTGAEGVLALATTLIPLMIILGLIIAFVVIPRFRRGRYYQPTANLASYYQPF
jgi:hypothetical protein